MNDLNISMGFIGKDVIAICRDFSHDYAFYARHNAKTGEYHTRIQSTDGLTTTGRFKQITSARQMLHIALSKHFEVQTKRSNAEADKHAAEEPKPALH